MPVPAADWRAHEVPEFSRPQNVEGTEFASLTAALGGSGGFVSIQDGSGSPASARVTGESNVGVEARSVDAGVVTTTASIGTTSTQLVAARANRKQFECQNLDAANDVHVLFGTGTATTDHFRMGPGERYALPAGVAYAGAVQVVASAAGTKVVVHEFT